MRFNAAEAMLGATALVLVVWVLWPESHAPKLDQRATWEKHVAEAGLLRDAGRERSGKRAASAETGRAGREDQAKPKLDGVVMPADSDGGVQGNPASAIAAAPAPQRRVLLMPSELADRRDAGGTGYVFGDDVAPARPIARGQDFELPPYSNAAAEALAAKAALEHEQVALGSDAGHDATHRAIIAEWRDEPSAVRPAAEGGRQDPAIDVAAYSTEAEDASSARAASLDDFTTDPAIAIPGFEVFAPGPPGPEVFSVESDSAGHVRKRPRDDAPSWLKNAVASSLIDDRPVIAVVIDDLGLNRAGTRALNDLPGPLTLAFLPYAGNLGAQTEAARRAGHELMVHLPMEPFGSAWPGPGALVTSLSHDAFVERLTTNLDRIKGYVGVNNHMGSRLTSDPGRMDLVMRELRKRDVLFLDSKTSPRSVASEMASRNGVPNTSRDVFLDHVIDFETIRRQMSLVERIARRSGSAVAIGHPHVATIRALREWLPGLAERGIVIAPISAVVARRACHDGLLIAAETCGHYLQAQKPEPSTLTAGGG